MTDKNIYENKGGKVELTHTEDTLKVDAYSYEEEKAFSTEISKDQRKDKTIEEVLNRLMKAYNMLPQTLKELEQWMERVI